MHLSAAKEWKRGCKEVLSVEIVFYLFDTVRKIMPKMYTNKWPFLNTCTLSPRLVAELNVDKSLIDKDALVQSDEVVAMQNGCVCCTLKNDLVEQITELAKSKRFDYMIVEASGISEVSNEILV